VPVSINKLRHPRNQAVLVSLVGPCVNIVLALIAGFAFRFATHGGVVSSANPDQWPLGDELLYIAGLTNVFIAAFNLIPIPPLDGSAVVERLLPASALPGYYRMRSYSMFIVLFIVLFEPGILSSLFNHATSIWLNIVLG
jgi:Zn-dependent protease